jgi:hypothetical protein
MTPLDRILRELGEKHRAQAAPADVERALLGEFRKRHGRSRVPWLRFAMAASVAALALGFYWVQPPAAQTIALHVEAPKAPEVKFTPKPLPKPAPRVVLAQSRRPAAQPKPESREIATDFFPLRAGPVLEPGEIARVVRTRVPRRELARFGLAGSSFYLSGASMRDIGADVVLGYDGTARAIRFVHDSQ